MNEYACATEGMEQAVLDWMGKVRTCPAARLGGPNAPVNPWPARVSSTRHGGMATNTSADGPMGKAPRECGVREARVTRVAFHPKALVVAIGYADGVILLCRLADAAEIPAVLPA